MLKKKYLIRPSTLDRYNKEKSRKNFSRRIKNEKILLFIPKIILKIMFNENLKENPHQGFIIFNQIY